MRTPAGSDEEEGENAKGRELEAAHSASFYVARNATVREMQSHNALTLGMRKR